MPHALRLAHGLLLALLVAVCLLDSLTHRIALALLLAAAWYVIHVDVVR